MKKHKNFDCVQVKWDIRQKLDKEFTKLSDQEICRIQWEKISSNKIIAPFLEKVRLLQKRAKLVSSEKFQQVLAKVSDAEPEEYDRL